MDDHECTGCGECEDSAEAYGEARLQLACFAMLGLIIKGKTKGVADTVEEAFDYADHMLEVMAEGE